MCARARSLAHNRAASVCTNERRVAMRHCVCVRWWSRVRCMRASCTRARARRQLRGKSQKSLGARCCSPQGFVRKSNECGVCGRGASGGDEFADFASQTCQLSQSIWLATRASLCSSNHRRAFVRRKRPYAPSQCAQRVSVSFACARRRRRRRNRRPTNERMRSPGGRCLRWADDDDD